MSPKLLVVVQEVLDFFEQLPVREDMTDDSVLQMPPAALDVAD